MIDIEKYYREKNLKGFVEECSKTDLLYPICIPSYKNRKIAEFLKLVLSKEREETFYIFLYEDDYFESKYNEYKIPKNVNLVIITKEEFKKRNIRWRGIQPKRKFIQQYMNELNIDKYFVVDDDIKEYGVYSGDQRQNKCKSRYVEKIHIFDLLKCIQYVSNLYNAAMCSASLIDLEVQFFKFKHIVKPWLCCGCILVNGKLLKDNSIYYTDDKIHEDHKMFIDCMKNDLVTIALCGFSHKANDLKSSSTYDRFELNIRDFIELYPYVKMKYNKKDSFFFTSPKIFDIVKYGINNICESEEDIIIKKMCLSENNKDLLLNYFKEIYEQ